MNYEEKRKLLCENLTKLDKNIKWLIKSFKKARSINLNKELNNFHEYEFEILETLSNRFGRTIDILINKVLRSLDLLEAEEINRKLDILIRAEKRGFVEDFRILIEMKDLRNEFAHEYIEERLIEKFKEILEKTPTLLEITEKVKAYIKKMEYC